MKNSVVFSIALGLVFLPFAVVNGVLIVANTSNTDINLGTTGFVGQSFTTPAGTPWDNITFSWLNGLGSASPTANGNAFLLSQQYLGAPASLSASTPGFIAVGTDAGTQYNFASAVTIQPNTQYWVYSDATNTFRSNFSDVLAGGNVYQPTVSSGGNFVSIGSRDAKFTLNGTAVPEPGAFLCLGLVGLGLVCWKKLATSRRIT